MAGWPSRWKDKLRQAAGCGWPLLVVALVVPAVSCRIKMPDVHSYAQEDLPLAGDVFLPDGWSPDWEPRPGDVRPSSDIHWQPPFPEFDLGPWPDQGEDDVVPLDLPFEVVEPPVIWECWMTEFDEEIGQAVKVDYLPQDFSSGIHTTSFQYWGVGLEKNIANPSYYTCGLDDYNDQKEEKDFIIKVDKFAVLNADVQCNSTCFVYLMKNGCMYDHLEQCIYNNGTKVHLETDLLPGMYMLGVEFLKQKDMVLEDFAFDIHVALNKTAGQAVCNVESASLISETRTDCDVGMGPSEVPIVVTGELSWMNKDDFYLTCDHFGAPADPMGGMPDVTHSLEADFSGSGLLEVDVSVVFPAHAQGDGYMLAVTTAPCGASESLIDCTWGVEPALNIHSISLFPGETVYAVIDGLATANPWETEKEYQLTWTVRDPCMK